MALPTLTGIAAIENPDKMATFDDNIESNAGAEVDTDGDGIPVESLLLVTPVTGQLTWQRQRLMVDCGASANLFHRVRSWYRHKAITQNRKIL